MKDLVTIGIFSALFLAFALVGGIFFAPNPVLTFYMPVGSALLCGPVYLLMLAKVQKRGATFLLAALLCYLPVIREDWRFIKDAMRLRDVSPTLWGFLKAPARTVNCIYVPLLTAASKAADELTVAAVTRGIENPKPRTCLAEIRMRAADWLILALFAAFLTVEIIGKAAAL